MEEIKPIDYQVGDVIAPKDERYNHIKSIVTDITERGIIVSLIGHITTCNILIRHHEGHLMTKCKAGTILYGNKDKKHSSD
jgi:rRNA processing protein Gar1